MCFYDIDSILSKSDRPQDVKESINRLWHLFFDHVPTDVVTAELKGFEEGIMHLHEKRSSKMCDR